MSVLPLIVFPATKTPENPELLITPFTSALDSTKRFELQHKNTTYKVSDRGSDQSNNNRSATQHWPNGDWLSCGLDTAKLLNCEWVHKSVVTNDGLPDV